MGANKRQRLHEWNEQKKHGDDRYLSECLALTVVTECTHKIHTTHTTHTSTRVKLRIPRKTHVSEAAWEIRTSCLQCQSSSRPSSLFSTFGVSTSLGSS